MESQSPLLDYNALKMDDAGAKDTENFFRRLHLPVLDTCFRVASLQPAFPHSPFLSYAYLGFVSLSYLFLIGICFASLTGGYSSTTVALVVWAIFCFINLIACNIMTYKHGGSASQSLQYLSRCGASHRYMSRMAPIVMWICIFLIALNIVGSTILSFTDENIDVTSGLKVGVGSYVIRGFITISAGFVSAGWLFPVGFLALALMTVQYHLCILFSFMKGQAPTVLDRYSLVSEMDEVESHTKLAFVDDARRRIIDGLERLLPIVAHTSHRFGVIAGTAIAFNGASCVIQGLVVLQRSIGHSSTSALVFLLYWFSCSVCYFLAVMWTGSMTHARAARIIRYLVDSLPLNTNAQDSLIARQIQGAVQRHQLDRYAFFVFGIALTRPLLVRFVSLLVTYFFIALNYSFL